MNILTIFMDCHGQQIYHYLKLNNIFQMNFQMNLISLNRYVLDTEKKHDSLCKNDIEILSKTDVLILQVIEKDRGFLNNSECIKYCKKDCIIIKIPHYRNSIYIYKILENKSNKYTLINNWDLPKKIDIDNIDETKKIINEEIDIMNNFPYDKNEMLNYIDFNKNHFKEIDNLSDIKMYDYFIDNWTKHKLFMGRSYPSSRFFFELTNKILIKLGFSPNFNYCDNYFAQNTSEPIPYYWYKFCNFLFDNTYYTYGNIEISECEWYYILLLSGNPNITSKETNLEYIKKIRQL